MSQSVEQDVFSPFGCIASLEPRDDIMQAVSQSCLSAVCLPEQERRAGELELWVGLRMTPQKGAEILLEKMGCGMRCPRYSQDAEASL